jgi:hypothetical protein
VPHYLGCIQDGLSSFLPELLKLENGDYYFHCLQTGQKEKFVGTLYMIAGDFPGISQAVGMNLIYFVSYHCNHCRLQRDKR